MSYQAFGENDQFAAGQYGVGSQSYYGRDSYAMPDPSASASVPPDTSSSGGGGDSTAATAPSSGGSAAPYAPPDTSGDTGMSAATLLVGVGAVALVGYFLFRGGR